MGFQKGRLSTGNEGNRGSPRSITPEKANTATQMDLNYASKLPVAQALLVNCILVAVQRRITEHASS